MTDTSAVNSPSTQERPLDPEREALLTTLALRRGFLLHAVRGLTDDAARSTPTVSALCLGGIVKHVSEVESEWIDFVLGGAAAQDADWGSVDWSAIGRLPEDEMPEWLRRKRDEFRLLADQTLAEVIASYEQVAQRTEQVVRDLPSLDVDHELPAAPWFAPGARWSARDVLLHIIGETAHHSGHADILRETVDGQKTMG